LGFQIARRTSLLGDAGDVTGSETGERKTQGLAKKVTAAQCAISLGQGQESIDGAERSHRQGCFPGSSTVTNIWPNHSRETHLIDWQPSSIVAYPRSLPLFQP
jgi:hypothetical protein